MTTDFKMYVNVILSGTVTFFDCIICFGLESASLFLVGH